MKFICISKIQHLNQLIYREKSDSIEVQFRKLKKFYFWFVLNYFCSPKNPLDSEISAYNQKLIKLKSIETESNS